jgi:imidazoleglycerol-phosphate dehydratase
MATVGHDDQARTGVRVELAGSGTASVATGLPVLDHLLGRLAEYAGFDLSLEVAPRDPDAEVGAAGRALGEALSEHLRAEGAPGHGWAVVPADEALAHVALDSSERALVVSNVDFSTQRIGGMATDLVARFLDELARGASIVLHVRLIEGRDTQHVLDSIFKALGVALAQACRPRSRKE